MRGYVCISSCKEIENIYIMSFKVYKKYKNKLLLNKKSRQHIKIMKMLFILGFWNYKLFPFIFQDFLQCYHYAHFLSTKSSLSLGIKNNHRFFATQAFYFLSMAHPVFSCPVPKLEHNLQFSSFIILKHAYKLPILLKNVGSDSVGKVGY